MNKCVYPFLWGTILFPVLSFFHECGHYLVGLAFGAHPEMHIGYVRIPGGHSTRLADFCCNAAGPLVDALFLTIGLLWLRRERGACPKGIPTQADWLATGFVQRAIGPVVSCVALLAGAPGLPDEAEMSLLLGLSKWVLPVIWGVLALTLFVWAVRLLPPGYRFLPLVCMLLGSALGLVLPSVLVTLSTGKLPEFQLE